MIREKRTYNLQKRARAAEETRQRIIEAAHTLFSEGGYPNVSLDQIAELAGVSRQTLYVQFGSKTGVLEALFAHAEHQSFGTSTEFEDTLDELARTQKERADPVSDLLVICRHAFRMVEHFYTENAALIRNCRAQAVYEPEFRTIWVRGMNSHRFAMHRVVRTIAALGRLAPGWTVESAADWLAAVAHYNQFDMLVEERGWSPEMVSERIVQLIREMLVTDVPDIK
jgi:AcrR family transcriptional regulator